MIKTSETLYLLLCDCVCLRLFLFVEVLDFEERREVLWDFEGSMASTVLLVVVFVFDLIAFALAVAAEQRRSSVSLSLGIISYGSIFRNYKLFMFFF